MEPVRNNKKKLETQGEKRTSTVTGDKGGPRNKDKCEKKRGRQEGKAKVKERKRAEHAYSSSLISPSPSRSASVIISCSSSSVMFSPISLATRRRFFKLILPVSSSSNKRKAFRISSLLSFSPCPKHKQKQKYRQKQQEMRSNSDKKLQKRRVIPFLPSSFPKILENRLCLSHLDQCLWSSW